MTQLTDMIQVRTVEGWPEDCILVTAPIEFCLGETEDDAIRRHVRDRKAFMIRGCLPAPAEEPRKG